MREQRPRAGGARRSRLTGVKTLAGGVLLLLAISLMAAAFFVLSPAGTGVSASFIHAQPGSIPWNTRDRLNILLLGVDSSSGHPSRTDAMVIASFDPRSRSIGLVSIPGNLWVTVPGYGQARVSEAYADGGPRLSQLVVESITHVPIPYYVASGYDSFRQIVDALGGITMTVPRSVPHVDRALHIVPGIQHMDGAAALAYVRMPGPDSVGDVGRMGRQRQMLVALKAQALQPQTLFRVPGLVNALGGQIATNFPYNQLPDLAHDLMLVPRSSIRTAELDRADSAVTNYSSNGADVLLPDWQHIRSIVQAMFPDPTLGTRGEVEILNGSGIVGQATSLAQWLRLSNLGIRGVGSASSYNYAHTEVTVSSSASAHNLHVARSVAALLQAPLVTRSVWRSRAPVTVIIGRDYQDLSQQ